jgi:hypothetical protein
VSILGADGLTFLTFPIDGFKKNLTVLKEGGMVGVSCELDRRRKAPETPSFPTIVTCFQVRDHTCKVGLRGTLMTFPLP